MTVAEAVHRSFHGIDISIRATKTDLLRMLDQRLEQLPIAGSSRNEVSFEFYGVASADAHVVTAPAGAGRHVYDPPVGEVRYFDDLDVLYIDYAGQARVLCRPAAGTTQFSYVEPVADNLWLVAHPLFTLPLVETLKRRGFHSVHGAALTWGEDGVLIAGSSGSGKTTLALALASAGWSFLGDDMTFLCRVPGGLRMFGFPDRLGITDETAFMFPELVTAVNCTRGLGWPKRQLDASALGSTIVSSCSPALVVFPQVTDCDESCATPMTAEDALIALAPNVLLTDRTCAQDHVSTLAELVRSVPCYRLEMGRDLASCPQLLSLLKQRSESG